MGRKVAIVAKAGTSALAPWHDSDWEIWGLPWIRYPRVDRYFEMHELAAIGDDETCFFKDKKWLEHYRDRTPCTPIYCPAERLADLPNSVEYPLEEILKALPIPFLENSIAYQIALAIHEGVEEIGLWGVHMTASKEYLIERPSVVYLIGLAQGMGINVTIPAGCPLFMSGWMEGRYGVTLERRELPR